MKKIHTVFLIDDDTIFTLLLTTHLKNLLPDAQIYDFADGQGAIIQIQQIVPDLIFLDLYMPVFDGWEFLDALEKMKIPTNFDIYITTISDYEASFERFIKNSLVKGVLFKPIRLETLKKLVYNV